MIALLSYPRSGNHLVRYIIEFLTARPTLGSSISNPTQDLGLYTRAGPCLLDHVTTEKDPVARKYHFHKMRPPKFSVYEIACEDGLILVLRHPIEAILSHHRHIGLATQKVDYTIWQIDDIKKRVEDFLGNLEFYQTFKKPKVCVIYENLSCDEPEGAIEKIASFFTVEKSRQIKLVENFEKYKSDCFRSLKRPAASATQKLSDSSFYRNQLKMSNPKNYQTFRRLLREVLNHPIITENYEIEKT